MPDTPTDPTEMQFTCMDDYFRILAWMKDCGDTSALADEIHYTTPIMLIQTGTGTAAAEPGDWIVRGDGDRFRVRRAVPEPQLITTADQIRALPLGSVLLDSSEDAWQVCEGGWLAYARTGNQCDLTSDDGTRTALKRAPFRVLYTPGGDRA